MKPTSFFIIHDCLVVLLCPACLDEQSLPVRADYHGSGDNQELEEPCQRLLEDLSLERRKTVDGNDSMSISSR
jgi:hypothetical protein